VTTTDVVELQRRFGIRGVVDFDLGHGLPRVKVQTSEATATLYLQGAQLTDWQPACQEKVLFLSRTSLFEPGTAIRGGIPISFPWFASDSKRDRVGGRPGPSHGFARLESWQMREVRRRERTIEMELALGPTEMSRSMGFDDFLLTLNVSVGKELVTRLTVRNTGRGALEFELAFHNYFSVVDVHEASVTGLESAAYFDKTDERKQKPAAGTPIRFTGPTDRVYLNTDGPCVIHDGAERRDIRIVKTNSRNTVVWNPGKALADLGEWDWHEMLCVETADVGRNARVLAAGETFTMGEKISVHAWRGPECADAEGSGSHGSGSGSGSGSQSARASVRSPRDRE
jgi:glucose-6-phosphate 1-epimerase